MSKVLDLLNKAREDSGLSVGEVLNQEYVLNKLTHFVKKMRAYNDFGKKLSTPDNSVENVEHVLSKKNENIVLHGEQTIVKEARTR